MTLATRATRDFVEQQIRLYEVMLKQPPMAAFLRQQALAIDMALSAFRTARRLKRLKRQSKTGDRD
ncbi:MAG: hypothetical protein AAFQ35_06220 [Pseudomonadota bacterium]